jgi:hypothetical protein
MKGIDEPEDAARMNFEMNGINIVRDCVNQKTSELPNNSAYENIDVVS